MSLILRCASKTPAKHSKLPFTIALIPEFRELLKREGFNVIHKMGIYTPIPRVEKVKHIRNSYLYSRLSCHAFSFLQWLCRYQQYVCRIRPQEKH